MRSNRIAEIVVLAVVLLAATALGFWLGASGDVVGALLVASSVLAVVLPGFACLVVPGLVIRPDDRAAQLGLALDGPAAWRTLSVADTVAVRRPEDPLRPTVLGAFHELDALGLRTVLVLDDPADGPTLDDPWAAVDAVRLGRRVRRLLRQNLVVAVVATAVLVPAAAAGFVGLVPTALGAVGAALVVVANSARISRFRSSRPPAHRPHGPARGHRRVGRRRPAHVSPGSPVGA